MPTAAVACIGAGNRERITVEYRYSFRNEASGAVAETMACSELVARDRLGLMGKLGWVPVDCWDGDRCLWYYNDEGACVAGPPASASPPAQVVEYVRPEIVPPAVAVVEGHLAYYGVEIEKLRSLLATLPPTKRQAIRRKYTVMLQAIERINALRWHLLGEETQP